MSEVMHYRGTKAALSRSRDADDPELVGASRNLAVAKLAAYVERVVSEAPPLTDAQRERIVALLRPIPTADADDA